MPVVILNIDKDQRRISLSHKHCQDNPWDMLEQQYEVGTETVGSVIEITDKGLVVELEGDVEGFIPVSQVGVEEVNNLAEHFNLGEDLNMVVLEFDRDQKRIVLSVRRYYEQKSEDDLAEYLKAHEARPITIAEVVEGEDGEVADVEAGGEPTGDDADVAAEEVVEGEEGDVADVEAGDEPTGDDTDVAAEEVAEEAEVAEDAAEEVEAEVEADATEEAVETDEPEAEEAEEEAVEAESDDEATESVEEPVVEEAESAEATSEEE